MLTTPVLFASAESAVVAAATVAPATDRNTITTSAAILLLNVRLLIFYTSSLFRFACLA
jgi:hypothetical protein